MRENIKNRIFSFRGYLMVLAVILMTSVSYFAFSMNDAWAFDVFSDDVMISNMIYDANPENSSPENILVQQALEGGGVIKDIYSTGQGQENLTFINYTSQVGFHGVIQSFFASVLPLPASVTLELFWLFNCFLLSVVLLVVFLQLDKLLNTNYWLILCLLTALFFSDVMKYGSNLYWNGWAMFLPFAVSLIFVNSKLIRSKYSLIATFIATFVPLFLKLLFSYEFVSTIMISQMIPIIYYILSEKLPVKKSVATFIIGSAGAVSAFVATLAVQLVQSFIAYKSADNFFIRLNEILLMRVFGDATSTVEIVAESAKVNPLSVILRFLTIEMSAVLIASVLFIHVAAVFVITFIYAIINPATRADHKLTSFGVATAISFLAPISWYVLAAPHAFIHVEQCATLWFIPTVYMVVVYTISCIKIMRQTH